MEQKAPVNYPLIVTLDIAAEDMQLFNDLRKAHFPAHANYLEAHLTLFHHLPSREPDVDETLVNMARREPFVMEVAAVKSIGNGVVYAIESETLLTIHKSLQAAFMPWLKRQDQQGLRPHITVQNKVTAFKASRLLEELSAGFAPFSIRATGFRSWFYLGGPWRPAGHFPFGEG